MSEARELDLALMMADLCGYTALTETHGALQASETVLRFVRLVEASLEPGVRIVDSIGDSVFCAGEDTLAVVRTALRLREAVGREPGFPRVSTGIHRGPIVEREARLFGGPINLTARLTSHAAGEQILCTAPIAGAIAAVAGVDCRPLGEQHFKNVAHPVDLFELVQADEARATIAIDPVCRMQVDVDSAAARVEHGGKTYWFCSKHCGQVFAASPGLYT
ncbi:MAG: YHS domain-containing protein [Proteobacteria bacterium]|nr:YHS domain-containing protein [Pseudomonadota bacterium]